MSKFNEVRPDPESFPKTTPVMQASELVSAPKVNPAEWMYERIVRSINDFEEKLDQDHEVGACLVNFGSNMTFHIEDVGYWGPDIITFYGKSQDGNSVELLQHISQLSVLLVSLNKVHEEPRRIGFKLIESVEKDKG